MLVLAPTPVPVPTVTVTQTVIVPTTFPTPIISVPPESVDMTVLMDGFFGALTGALTAAGIAWWLVRRERHARLDERRRDQAGRLTAALRDLLYATSSGDRDTVFPVIREALGASTPLLTPLRKDPYAKFRLWLMPRMRYLTSTWLDELRDTSQIQDETERREERKKLGSAVSLIHANVERWIADPDRWIALTEDDQKEFISSL